MEKIMEYIMTICEEKSFSRAATKLFISQPSLSAMVKREEDRLGLSLFNRNITPIQPTAAGECYIQAASQIKSVENQLQTSLNRLREIKHGTLSIGSSAFFCAHILPSLAIRFQKKYSEYGITILEGNSRELLNYLHNGTINFIVEVESYSPVLYDSLVLQKEDIILAAPAKFSINASLASYALSREDIISGHFQDSSCKSVSLKRFSQEPFILLKQGNDLNRRALQMFHKNGIEPKVAMYLDQIQTSYFVAKDGRGVAFIRASMLEHLEPTNKLVFYKVQSKLASRYVRLFYRKKGALSHIEEMFLDFCREESLSQT
jgi:DNA-binding transcriptional LysR family regulator